MKAGDLVMLIGKDDFMPRLGAIGMIIEPFDGEDFGVHFPAWPCPVGEFWWYVPPRWLMLIPPRPILAVLPSNELPCEVNHAC